MIVDRTSIYKKFNPAIFFTIGIIFPILISIHSIPGSAALLNQQVDTTPTPSQSSPFSEYDLVNSPTPTETTTVTATPIPLEETRATDTTENLWPSLTPTLIPIIPEIITSETITSPVYLPLIIQAPTPTPIIPPTKVLFCDSINSPLMIPDDNAQGVNNKIRVFDSRFIADLDISLDIDHTWVGDLVVSLTHQETQTSITLINRPGKPATTLGCGNDNIKTILDDEISSSVENKCASSPAAISGIYLPQNALTSFDGESILGNWNLNVADRFPNDTGKLNHWCLIASISQAPPPPTPPPPVPSVPSSANISSISGDDQSLPLDCESRSAVDWAGYFDYQIDEIKFYNKLPHSDNPDKGFVGSVYGTWGQIPPNPYGVHAEPIANMLRSYGVSAFAHRPLRWIDVQAEIAAGRPVMVWIIGSVINGIPVYYTPSDTLSTVVARYEHTVIVTGYTGTTVSFLNGDTIYTKNLNQFLDSWSALGNMAITANP